MKAKTFYQILIIGYSIGLGMIFGAIIVILK